MSNLSSSENLAYILLSTRSSLHSYLLSCDPPSHELVAGVALVARLTALLDQFPDQVSAHHLDNQYFARSQLTS